MQKFTIFTIIFSVIVLSITAELVIQDYPQQLYPPSTAANILSTLDDLDPTTKSESDLTAATNDAQPDSSADSQEPATASDEITASPEFTVSSAPAPSSEKVLGLLATIDLPSLEAIAYNYNGKLFDLITTNINPDEVALMQLVLPAAGDKTDLVGTIYEYNLPDQASARRLYTEIKKQAQAYANIDVNETDQFGDNSFYINHQVKVAEVFVVTISGNQVYALAYGKEYHEMFKPFMGLLL